MFNYDYVSAYSSGNLSEFLYQKAQVYDRDRSKTLDKFEYERFQQWINTEDIEQYGLDIINISFKEKVTNFEENLVPKNIRESEIISDKQKNRLRLLNKISAMAALGGVVGGACMSAGGATGKKTLIGGLGLYGGIAAMVTAIGVSLGSRFYKKHLEKIIANENANTYTNVNELNN